MTEFLPVSFFILQYAGLWRPVHWSKGWKKRLYPLFTIFVFTLMLTDTGSQIVDIFEKAKTLSEFADGSFILLSMVGILAKMVTIVNNRKHITVLVEVLNSGSFKTRNPDEDKIRQRFEHAMK